MTDEAPRAWGRVQRCPSRGALVGMDATAEARRDVRKQNEKGGTKKVAGTVCRSQHEHDDEHRAERIAKPAALGHRLPSMVRIRLAGLAARSEVERHPQP